MHDECLEDLDDDANTVYAALKAMEPGPFIVKLYINGVCVTNGVRYDTGASFNCYE